MEARKIFIVILLAVTAWGSAGAQGYPVIDIMNLLQAVESALTMWDQVEAGIQQVENTYRQLEATAKAFKEYKPEEFDWSDPKKIKDNLRGSMRSVMTYTDDMMNLEKKMENLLNAKNIKFGNRMFSWSDVYTSGPAEMFAELTGEAVGFVITDNFSKALTKEDRAKFFSRYGLSANNYYRLNAIKEIAEEKSLEVVKWAMEVDERKKATEEASRDITAGAATESSAVKQRANIIVQLYNIGEWMKEVGRGIGKMSTQLALRMKIDEEHRKEREEERGTNHLDVISETRTFMGLMPGPGFKENWTNFGSAEGKWFVPYAMADTKKEEERMADLRTGLAKFRAGSIGRR